MTKAVWVMGAGLGVLAAFSGFLVARTARIEDRVAGLERSVRGLAKAPAAVPPERTPSTAPPDSRIDALEKAVREIQSTPSVVIPPPVRTPAEVAVAETPPPTGTDRPAETPPAGPAPNRNRGTGQPDREDAEAGEIVARWEWSVFAGFLRLDPEQAGDLEPVFRNLALEMTAARENLRSAGDYGLARIREMDRDLKRMLYDQAASRVNASQAGSLKSWCAPPDPADTR